MLTYEYKIQVSQAQQAAIEEAIRTAQFVRNKCLRRWMDTPSTSQNDRQAYCTVLAQAFSFASCLNSQARQTSADRAWATISCFHDNCRASFPGKKGYPCFQHDNRSVEHKTIRNALGVVRSSRSP